MEKFVIVLDTETTNSIEEPIAYDMGWAVIDTENGNVVKTESFAIANVFCDKELMENAYFAEKIPTYWNDIKNGKRKLAPLFKVWKTLREDCKVFGIEKVFAHNGRFDDLAMKITNRYITYSKYRYFLPYGVKMQDTLKMSRKALAQDNDYIAFCEENNYKTANGKLRFTAEIIYRFLTNDNNFVEEHQGLDDVLIEKEILMECIRRGVEDGDLY